MPTFDELLLQDYTQRDQPTPARHRTDGPAHTPLADLRDSFRDGIREGWHIGLNIPTSTPAGGIAWRRIWGTA